MFLSELLAPLLGFNLATCVMLSGHLFFDPCECMQWSMKPIEMCFVLVHLLIEQGSLKITKTN